MRASAYACAWVVRRMYGTRYGVQGLEGGVKGGRSRIISRYALAGACGRVCQVRTYAHYCVPASERLQGGGGTFNSKGQATARGRQWQGAGNGKGQATARGN